MKTVSLGARITYQEMVAARKFECTRSTNIILSWVFIVCAAVPFHRAGLSEANVADVAEKRLFHCVNTVMVEQVRPLPEALATLLALKLGVQVAGAGC